MSILTSLILLVAIFLVALFVSYYMQTGQPTTKEWNKKITENLVKQQEVQEKENLTKI